MRPRGSPPLRPQSLPPRGSFFERLLRDRIGFGVLRADREPAIAECRQRLANRRLMHLIPQGGGTPALQILAAPTDLPVPLRVRPRPRPQDLPSGQAKDAQPAPLSSGPTIPPIRRHCSGEPSHRASAGPSRRSAPRASGQPPPAPAPRPAPAEQPSHPGSFPPPCTNPQPQTQAA